MDAGPSALRHAAHPLLAVLILAVAAVEGLARMVGGPGPLAALRGGLFAQIAFASVLVVFCLAIPDRRTSFLALAGGILGFDILALVLLAAGIREHDAGFALLVPAGAVGLAAFVVAILASRGAARERWMRQLGIALAIPLIASTAPFGLWVSMQQNPVYDLYILAFEETLGIRASVAITGAAAALPGFTQVCTAAYFGVTFGPVLLRVMRHERPPAVDALLTFAVAGMLGFLLYFVMPAVGPTQILAEHFGGVMPPPGTVVAGPVSGFAGAPRNAMPSLHTAWSLIIWFNAAALARLPRLGFRVFAALNVAATMVLGEHWITDLVVAVPLAVAIQALCSTAVPLRAPVRIRAITVGLALTAAWLVALRWRLPIFAVPGLSWIALIATVVVPLLLERALRARGAASAAGLSPASPAAALPSS